MKNTIFATVFLLAAGASAYESIVLQAKDF